MGKKHRTYTPEFKIKVITIMRNENLSYRKTARQFNIPEGAKTVSRWEKKYLDEGLPGLYTDGRGRRSDRIDTKKSAKKDLQAEIQQLRAENAYLKKLQQSAMDILDLQQHADTITNQNAYVKTLNSLAADILALQQAACFE